jgi:hypothetical protein
MKTTLFAFVIGMGLLAVGCKKDDTSASDTPYYQEYEVTFNKTDAIRSASATFRMRDSAGSKVVLNDRSYVKVNGRAMTANGDSYTWSDTGFNDLNFALLKNEDKAFFNTATYTSVKDFAFPASFPSAFYRIYGGVVFNWDGDIASDSSGIISVTVSGRDSTDSTKTVTVSQVLDINKVNIPASELTNMKNGAIIITLSRTKKLPLNAYDGNGGGRVIQTIKEYRNAQLKTQL